MQHDFSEDLIEEREDRKISVEKLNLSEIKKIFSKIFNYSENLKTHDIHTDKIQKFAYLSVHGQKKDTDFFSFFEDLIPIVWLENYEENANIFLRIIIIAQNKISQSFHL